MKLSPKQELEFILGIQYRVPENYICEKLSFEAKRRNIKELAEKRKAVQEYSRCGNEFFDVLYCYIEKKLSSTEPDAKEAEEYDRSVSAMDEQQKVHLDNLNRLFSVDETEVIDVFRKMSKLRRSYRKERKTFSHC
jgi:hypothetical protein